MVLYSMLFYRFHHIKWMEHVKKVARNKCRNEKYEENYEKCHIVVLFYIILLATR